MNDSRKIEARSRQWERYVWSLALAWTIVVAGLLAWDVHTVCQVTRDLAINEARAHFMKDQAFRFWATAHGGVYVPTDDRTPSNPYLAHVPERDIETPSGRSLTLMNPAYMVRQLNEEFADLYGVAGHLTSLNPLRPENAPDSWEEAALETFEQGEIEVREFTKIDGELYLRLMQPMIAQEGCLKCHGHQGYQVGDVRGGVSVSVPLASYLTKERQTITTHALSLSLLWVLGFAGIGLGWRGLRQSMRERDQAQEALQEAHDRLEIRVRERTAELERANEQLTQEITERKRTEWALGERVKELTCLYAVNRDMQEDLSIDELCGRVVEHLVSAMQFPDITVPVIELDDRRFASEGYAEGLLHGLQAEIRVGDEARGQLGVYYVEDRSFLIPEEQNLLNGIAEALGLWLERKRSKEVAEAASRAKSEFLASMSHELRTPLNAVIGFSEVLQEQYFGELNEKQSGYVGDILDSGKHLLSLINDVLDLSKIEAGKEELELSRVKLEELLENSLVMIREKAMRHGIGLDLHISPDVEGLEITADERKLRQTMFNLLSNAAKFTPDGGAIAVEAKQEGEELVISVADTGIGIAPEDQEKIFEEFYQVRGGMRDKTPGTGLGLSLTQRFVEMHGGRLWVESEGEGKGSRFSFALPLGGLEREVKKNEA